MKAGLAIVIVVILGVLVIGGSMVSARNGLVVEKNEVDQRWAQVDNDMKRRADLIPNLVETVKGYAKQEQTVFGEIANARAALGGAATRQDEIKANDQLSSALGRLLVIKEAYPDLKSNESFMRLQDELAGTENRIAVSRRDYNLAVQKYNTDIDLFPKNIAASIFGFNKEKAYFEATPDERKTPQVKF